MGADVLLVLILAGGFMLGFFRGVVRQVLALGAWLVMFVGSAYLRVPLGEWLARSSQQYNTDFALMLAFGVTFVALFGAALALVEFGGAPSRLTRHPVLDDALGGFLGLLLAGLTLAALMIILDSYFLRVPTGPAVGELDWLREVHRALAESTVAQLIHDWLVRGLSMLVGPLLPADVRAVMA